MNIKEELQEKSQNTNGEIFDFFFESKALSYKSLLKGFNKDIFDLFDLTYKDLDIDQGIKDLFHGEEINVTEKQSALHHIYRDIFSENPNNFQSEELLQNCRNSIQDCIELRTKLLDKGIKNIVTIGIGGSFEGPKLLIETLTNSSTRHFNHIFLTGPDHIEFNETIEPLVQEETFFIVSSKSFSTDETLQSLELAKNWISRNCDFNSHFIAITSQPNKAKELGFNNMITFPNEIGGRYSMWSPIALPAILELGKGFIEFLKGGGEADNQLLCDNEYKDFIKTLSFSDLWYSNFMHRETRVLLAYSWKMRFFNDYAQQLEMESIGKQPNKNSLFQKTGQIVFGGFGSTAQHSYFQLLHQGTSSVCADIFTIEDYKDKNKLLFAQSQAQANLLASGDNADLKDYEKVNSNVPTNLFTLKTLNPFNLGYLIASWEHRTFMTSQMLEINPFDQYGVSAGKIFTNKYLDEHGG
jgi:glucose-6-phosphate isomerase